MDGDDLRYLQELASRVEHDGDMLSLSAVEKREYLQLSDEWYIEQGQSITSPGYGY